MNTAIEHPTHRPPRRAKRPAQRRGVYVPRQYPGHTFSEYERLLDAGELDQRLGWCIYQIADQVWQVARGRDRRELLLAHNTLVPRQFKSCAEAVNQLRERLGVLQFALEVLPDGRVVPGGRRAAEVGSVEDCAA